VLDGMCVLTPCTPYGKTDFIWLDRLCLPIELIIRIVYPCYHLRRSRLCCRCCLHVCFCDGGTFYQVTYVRPVFGRPRLIIIQARAQQNYVHEFSADHDHAMCKTQNRAIPLQFKELSMIVFKALAFSVPHSNAKCLSTKWKHSYKGCLAERECSM
jgi:hypothetical protein